MTIIVLKQKLIPLTIYIMLKQVFHKKNKMIFEQLFFNNFCDNFLSHTHFMFLLSHSIALVFVSISHFLCKILVVSKVVI